MSELKKLLSMPVTSPAILLLQIRKAYQAGLLDDIDLEILKDQWEFTVLNIPWPSCLIKKEKK